MRRSCCPLMPRFATICSPVAALFPVRPLTVGRVAPNLSLHAFAEQTLLPSTTATFRMSDS